MKIDRSSVSASASAEENAPFIRMIRDLARSLNVDVAAEGVETSA